MKARVTGVIGVCVMALLFAAASAQTQDVVTGNKRKKGARYEIKKKPKSAEASDGGVVDPGASTPPVEEELVIDARLADVLAGKIRVCYQEETKTALVASDQALVEEYKADLVLDLASGVRAAGCQIEQPATPQCLSALGAVTCEELAKAIKAKRWDKHLLQKDRDALAAYTGGIAKRKGECRAKRGVESLAIEQQIEADKLGVLAAINITVGRCQIDFAAQAACDAELTKMPCSEVDRAEQTNTLMNLCPSFLRCKSGPRSD